MRKFKMSIEISIYILHLLAFAAIGLFKGMYFGEKKKDSGKRLKKCGMRDFREKGAGMRDQYSALPFKTL